MRTPKLVTVDLETFYSKEYSLTRLTTEAYIRDPRFQIIGVSTKVDYAPAEWRSFATLQEYRDYLAPLLEGNFLLCHNTAFDGAILGWRLGIHPKFVFDTLSMARPENQMTVGVSLKALADKYTVGQKGTEIVLALGKRREDFTPEELHRYGEYCKNDVTLTHLLFHILKQDFPRQELKIIDLLVKMFTNPVLELDVPVLEEHLSHVQAQKAAALATVESLCTKSDIMSNAKFADILRGLGVDPPMKTSLTTGKETYAFARTDVGFKELLEHENLDVQAVVAARLGVKSTIEETRTQSFLGVAARGKLPVPLKYYGAHTGRVSAAEGSRLNMTNLTRGGALRRAVVPPKGYSLVVCDSSQIEARIVAWLAGEAELVAAFAKGEDIYSQFASKVYGKPVNKSENKLERHVGKCATLGLGFSMGPDKFQHLLKSGNPSVAVDSAEARRIVSMYRTTYSRIKRFWTTCDNALFAILKGEKLVFGANGVLETCAEGIRLPNGMMLRYPNLTYQDDQFAYTNDRRQIAAWTTMNLTNNWDLNKLTRVYGGKATENCLAEGTLVLSDRGWIPIEAVTLLDRVHDGEEFVSHSGAVCKAVQDCISVDGVYMTHDHEVMTNEGWKKASQLPRPYRPAVRNADRLSSVTHRREEVALGVSVPVRGEENTCRERRAKGGIPWRNTELRLRHEQAYVGEHATPRDDKAPSIRRISKHDRPLQTALSRCVEELRGAWRNGVRAVEGALRTLLGRHGAYIPEGVGVGSDGQRSWILSRKLPLGDAQGKLHEQAKHRSHYGHTEVVCPDRGFALNFVLSSQPRAAANRVYDIINAGKRQRFVVLGEKGPFIVHNCVQALARIVVMDQLVEISKRYRPVHTVYDDIALCVPDAEAEDAKAFMLEAMSVAPDWAPGLPIACEAAIGKNYADAK